MGIKTRDVLSSYDAIKKFVDNMNSQELWAIARKLGIEYSVDKQMKTAKTLAEIISDIMIIQCWRIIR
jgi:hypothetical protein